MCRRRARPAEYRANRISAFHLDRKAPLALAPAFQNAVERFDLKRIARSIVVQQEPGDAARAVAAGAGFAAVAIVDAHIGFGAGRHRRVQNHELVETQIRRLGDGANYGWVEPIGGVAQIEDEDRVAEAVHLRHGSAREGVHSLRSITLHSI